MMNSSNRPLGTYQCREYKIRYWINVLFKLGKLNVMLWIDILCYPSTRFTPGSTPRKDKSEFFYFKKEI